MTIFRERGGSPRYTALVRKMFVLYTIFIKNIFIYKNREMSKNYIKIEVGE